MNSGIIQFASRLDAMVFQSRFCWIFFGLKIKSSALDLVRQTAFAFMQFTHRSTQRHCLFDLDGIRCCFVNSWEVMKLDVNFVTHDKQRVGCNGAPLHFMIWYRCNLVLASMI